MGLITRDCPHCQSENVAFSSFGEIANPHEQNTHTVPFYCANCYGGIFAEIYCFTNKRPNGYKGYLETTPYFEVKTTYPVSNAST
jgi:C4-type Zn-finger protein